MLNVYLPVVQGGNVCKWADDSQRLILEHFDTINNSPSQIYCYALPFAPSSSWLHKYYTPELLQGPKVVRGAKAEWGACSRTVPLDDDGKALSCWNNTIAVGIYSGSIAILSAITGTQVAVLSGHTGRVKSLTFSSDGRSLVSGSNDKTVKLWDMQTGGVVKTFHGHTDRVNSVSISVDCVMIASGSDDKTICLWGIQIRECLCTIQQQEWVRCVSFSPLNPQHIFSISGGKIWEWDVNGHQIPSIYDGSCIMFSPDHAQFALKNGSELIVYNSHSRAIVTKFNVANNTSCHCFSPDRRLIAAADNKTAYVWDITSQDPHLIETFIGHTGEINSLVFSSPSSLVSTGRGRSVKFWKIGTLLTDNAATNTQSTPPSSASIKSISLQARDGVAISSDSKGVVKIWDISTGACRAAFQTPVKFSGGWAMQDARLIDNRLIVIWRQDHKIHIWEAEKGELLQNLRTPRFNNLRISGDGSKIICLSRGLIQAWSMWTWELVCEIKSDLRGNLYPDFLCTESPRIWICSYDSPAQEGWDFGTSGSAPVPFDPSTGRPHLDLVSYCWWKCGDPLWIKDTVTGKRVFQLSGKYAMSEYIRWDGQFLVAGYDDGEVLILDFHHISSQVIQ